MGYAEVGSRMTASSAQCTFLANCKCPACLKEKASDGNFYEGQFGLAHLQQRLSQTNLNPGSKNSRTNSPSPSLAHVPGEMVRSLSKMSGTLKEGWLLIRADAKNKSKTFAKHKFKKHYVVVSKNLLEVKKSMDGKTVRSVDLSKSMVGFQNDDKIGNYIRIANPGYVLEIKPSDNNPNTINSWMIAFQSNQSNMDLTGKSKSTSRFIQSPSDEPVRARKSEPLLSPTPSSFGGSRMSSTSSLGSAASTSPGPVLALRKPSLRKGRPVERKFMEINVKKLAKESLGMKICGGVTGNPDKPEVYVHTIAPGGLADQNRFCVGDIIVHVNHRKLDDVTIEAASSILSKAFGLVAIGVSRKMSSKPGQVRRDSEAELLDQLPKAESEETEKVIEKEAEAEVFGFPSTDDEDDGDIISETTESKGVSPRPSVAEEPSPSPPPAPVVVDERALRLQKMKEARLLRRNSAIDEVLQILSIIDNLDEDC
eukprot:m.86364 g.86364  ORF g.86364 m.86364 type:complete len:482 (+) comp25958_c0_seq1:347-1792(+)